MSGTVYWLTGLSGSGKTTIGKLFYKRLRDKKPNVVFLDGDSLRETIADDLGHSLEERKKSAMRNSRLCRLLAGQGIDVICATISMFHDCHRWNRRNISRYREIYIRVPIEVLIKRDQKQLYSRALKGEIKHVWGVDLKVEEPEDPDLILDNDGSQAPDELVNDLFNRFINCLEDK